MCVVSSRRRTILNKVTCRQKSPGVNRCIQVTLKPEQKDLSCPVLGLSKVAPTGTPRIKASGPELQIFLILCFGLWGRQDPSIFCWLFLAFDRAHWILGPTQGMQRYFALFSERWRCDRNSDEKNAQSSKKGKKNPKERNGQTNCGTSHKFRRFPPFISLVGFKNHQCVCLFCPLWIRHTEGSMWLLGSETGKRDRVRI